LIELLAKNKSGNSKVFLKSESLPPVSIIMSVYNEEKVIREKIDSIYNSNYPAEKIELLVGSDNSTDVTNMICTELSEKYPGFRFFPFSIRQGKPSVINQLAEKARYDHLIFTDAKVFFTDSTLYELVKHFKNEKIDIVGGNILNRKVSKDGISRQEKAFMSREIQIKRNEGILWGQTIGVYGAIYAIRKKAFHPVPEGYSVDDFYITMSVLKEKGRAIMELNSITIEDVPNQLSTEFKRKVRISAGNFQNLKKFFSCLFPPWSSLSFAFMSHKVIRWLGPILLLTIFISNLFLLNRGLLYNISFYLQIFLFIIPLIDLFLRKLNIHVVFLRFVTHFLTMNLALLTGLIKQLAGIKTNIWQPTKR
jgi:cellulose synthase/poly-beta-1,6-N-acetylglucosamine synthase-like glycosyltransferase